MKMKFALAGCFLIGAALYAGQITPATHPCVLVEAVCDAAPIQATLDGHCGDVGEGFVDSYHVRVQKNQGISAFATSSAFPPVLELRRADDGTLLRRDSNPQRTDTARISYEAFDGGEFVIYVGTAVPEGTGFYTLTLPCPFFDPPPPAGSCTPTTSELCLANRFTVAVYATDQRTANNAVAIAIQQNDLFGYFSFPALTGSAENPEAFAKMIDGRPVNEHFWFFYGTLTDLELMFVVRDEITGAQRAYRKAAGSACGGFDTSAF